MADQATPENIVKAVADTAAVPAGHQAPARPAPDQQGAHDFSLSEQPVDRYDTTIPQAGPAPHSASATDMPAGASAPDERRPASGGSSAQSSTLAAAQDGGSAPDFGDRTPADGAQAPIAHSSRVPAGLPGQNPAFEPIVDAPSTTRAAALDRGGAAGGTAAAGGGGSADTAATATEPNSTAGEVPSEASGETPTEASGEDGPSAPGPAAGNDGASTPDPVVSEDTTVTPGTSAVSPAPVVSQDTIVAPDPAAATAPADPAAGNGGPVAADPAVGEDMTAAPDPAGGTAPASPPTAGPVNHAPTGIPVAGGSIAENSVAGSVVATLAALDPDAGDSHTFTLINDPSGFFEIAGNEIRVKAGAALDHETAQAHPVTVQVTDAGGLSTTQDFTLTVTDVNETPTGIGLDNTSLAENAAGAVVGALSLVDPDAGDSFTYTVSDDRFEVVDGALKLKDGIALDHEAEPALGITVNATDSGGLSAAQDFTLTVTDRNEAPTGIEVHAPNGVEVTVGFVSESAGHGNSLGVYYRDADGNPVAGQVVWANSNDIPEGASATVSFAGVDQADIGYFLIPNGGPRNRELESGDKVTFRQDADGNWQAVLEDGTPLSGRQANVYFSGGSELNADGVDHTQESGNRIAFEDQYNGADKNFGDLVFSTNVRASEPGGPLRIAENQSGVTVGTLSATDPDAGDTVTYAITDDPSGLFEIVGNELRLKAGAAADYETAPSHAITVEARDSGGLSHTETVTIEVDNVAGATITGGKGHDTLSGTGEEDHLSGKHGNDRLVGGAGDDVLVGGAGADLLEGGAGNDTLQFSADGTWGSRYSAVNTETGDRVSLKNLNRSYDTFRGGEGEDTLVGTDRADAIFLDDGISQSYPGAAGPRLDSIENFELGDGNDVLDMTSNRFSYDTNMRVDGGDGNDTIWSGSGDDMLIGGQGDDALAGGNGSDLFIFHEGDGHDTVNGGAGANWIDTLQLTDGSGEGSIGTLGTDWTLAVTSGSVVAQDEHSVTLSQDAAGSVVLSDGSQVDFTNLERITFA